MKLQHLHVLIVPFLVVTIAGCPGPPELEGVYEVSGTVRHQGQPVEGATVSFIPEGEGRAASGQTDSEGRYRLTTHRPGDGAMPGTYQVMIIKTEGAPGMSDEEAQAYFEEHGTPPPTGEREHLLPEQYANIETSGLTADVQADQPNQFDFDLE